MPFLADIAFGVVIDVLAFAALAASVIFGSVIPFLVWIGLWLLSDQLVPLKPNLKDPITKRQAQRAELPDTSLTLESGDILYR